MMRKLQIDEFIHGGGFLQYMLDVSHRLKKQTKYKCIRHIQGTTTANGRLEIEKRFSINGSFMQGQHATCNPIERTMQSWFQFQCWIGKLAYDAISMQALYSIDSLHRYINPRLFCVSPPSPVEGGGATPLAFRN